MSFGKYFSVFNKLTPSEQEALLNETVLRRVPAGTLITAGSDSCIGVVVVRSGQLREYITSEDGREMTVARLFGHDISILSASCIMNSINFDIYLSAEKDSEFWVIPPQLYRQLLEKSAPLANYTNRLLAASMTDIMWMAQQVLWKGIDRRLAHFLLDESAIEDSLTLKITHEAIAGHIGTAREVVTRMLRTFQSDGLVKLSRGCIEIIDIEKLEELDE